MKLESVQSCENQNEITVGRSVQQLAPFHKTPGVMLRFLLSLGFVTAEVQGRRQASHSVLFAPPSRLGECASHLLGKRDCVAFLTKRLQCPQHGRTHAEVPGSVSSFLLLCLFLLACVFSFLFLCLFLLALRSLRSPRWKIQV